MAVIMGPVLHFRGVEANIWSVSALLVIDGKDAHPKLTWGNSQELKGSTTVSAKVLKFFPASNNPEAVVLRFDVSVQQSGESQELFYKIGKGAINSFIVPKAGGDPQMAYASCNGFSDPKLMKKVRDNNALWKVMAEKHRKIRYNLLLLGGDQVYTDSMWVEVPELKEWCELDWKDRLKADFSNMYKSVDRFFFQLYIRRWSQEDPARMFSSVPSAMMWDDHDIFDGWGSYPKDQQSSKVYQGIFKVAREYFQIFQLATVPDELPSHVISKQKHFSYGHQIGSLGILALDMRSERTGEQVISLETWNAIRKWMDSLDGCKHLLVLCGIPVVHPDFSAVEKLLGALPGQQELEDDLKDHWHSLPHRHERLRFIHRLLDFSASKNSRVTLLSGDVHVAAIGVIQSQRNNAASNARVINQLTSSGIVHPAPPGMVLFFLESMGERVERPDRDISTEMLEFPATSRRFIGARNWLSLEPDANDRIWANWHVEGESDVYTKVLHAV